MFAIDQTSFLAAGSDTVNSFAKAWKNGQDQLFFLCTITPHSTISVMQIQEKIWDWFEKKPLRSDVAPFLYALENFHVQFVCLYICDNWVMCGAQNAHVILYRNGHVKHVVIAQDSVSCVEGAVQEDDVFFFATEMFSHTHMKDLLSSLDPVIFFSNLIRKSAMSDDPAQAACMLTLPQRKKQSVVLPMQAPVRQHVRKERLYFSSVSFFLARHARVIQKIALVCIILGSILVLSLVVSARRSSRVDTVVQPYANTLDQLSKLPSEKRVEQELGLTSLLASVATAKSANTNDSAVLTRLVSIEKQISKLLSTVSKQKKVESLSVFYDFRLVSPDLSASALSYDPDGRLLVLLDTKQSRLVTLSLDKKQPQTIRLPSEIGVSYQVAVTNKTAYVLGQNGIFSIGLPITAQGKIDKLSFDLSQGSDPLFSSFENMVYVMDAQKRQLVRQDTTDFSSSPSAWLRAPLRVNFDKLTAMAIDGDVWVGQSDGEIHLFSRGEERSFSIKNLALPLHESVLLYTSSKTQLLYVIEPKSGRLLVFEKNGSYHSSIQSSDFAGALAFIVDEVVQKAYVLAGSILFEVSL